MTSKSSRIPGGKLVAEALQAAGVEVAFALHGGHLEGLFKACDELDIRLIDCRHESAAVHAADAYARASGKVGVAIVTAGPGLTNAISGIANARLDRSPVLIICGAPPLRELETNELQGGIDQIALTRPVSKWALRIQSADRLRDLTAMALRKARASPTGPVVLELPIDILHTNVPAAQATPAAGADIVTRSAPAPQDVQALAAMIRQARRPVLIAGHDAANPHAAQALEQLTGRLSLPVFALSQATGVLPPDHPCWAGGAGLLGAIPLIGMEAPDLVILLGAEMGLLLGGRSGAVVPHEARLAQIHSDPSEPGRLRDVDLAICADSALAIEALDAALPDAPDFSNWCQQATGIRKMAAMAFANAPADGAGGIHPFHAARTIARVAGPGASYALDGGEAASWAGDAIDVDQPGHMLGHGYLGCLGIGPGFAMGLQLADPDRRVLLITGDGAFGFHLQELDSMIRHNLPIVTIVFNNRVWGMSIHGQQLMYGQNYNVITRLGETSYASVARGFGCHAERVDRLADLEGALTRALDAHAPAVVEVMVDADIIHPITISMLGEVAADSGDTMIPYYENLPD